MSIEWVLYWIDVLGNGKTFFSIVFVSLFIVFSVISAAAFQVENDEKMKTGKGSWIFTIFSFLLCLIFMIASTFAIVFIPSTKTMYAMVVARYSKDSEIPRKALIAIESKLDEIIEKGK